MVQFFCVNGMSYCSIYLYLDKENKLVSLFHFNSASPLSYSPISSAYSLRHVYFLWEKIVLLKKPEKRQTFFFSELCFHRALVFAKPFL